MFLGFLAKLTKDRGEVYTEVMKAKHMAAEACERQGSQWKHRAQGHKGTTKAEPSTCGPGQWAPTRKA